MYDYLICGAIVLLIPFLFLLFQYIDACRYRRLLKRLFPDSPVKIKYLYSYGPLRLLPAALLEYEGYSVGIGGLQGEDYLDTSVITYYIKPAYEFAFFLEGSFASIVDFACNGESGYSGKTSGTLRAFFFKDVITGISNLDERFQISSNDKESLIELCRDDTFVRALLELSQSPGFNSLVSRTIASDKGFKKYLGLGAALNLSILETPSIFFSDKKRVVSMIESMAFIAEKISAS